MRTGSAARAQDDRLALAVRLHRLADKVGRLQSDLADAEALVLAAPADRRSNGRGSRARWS